MPDKRRGTIATGRVRVNVEGAASLAFELAEHEDDVRKLLPAGYSIDGKKHVLTRK